MRPAAIRVLACLTALLAAAPAPAALTVLKADGSAAGPGEATMTYKLLTGSWDITLSALYAPGGDTVYEIRGNGGEVIDNIFIDVPCWEGPDGSCVPAGSPVNVHVFSDAPFGIDSINSIVQTGDAETLLLDVQANLDIGSITAEVIGTVVAGRDVLGPVISTTPDNPTRGIFWLEAHRDILGDVSAVNGWIGRVWAHRDIGSAAQPITIEAKHRINGIFCGDGDCFASWLAGNDGTCAGTMHADVNTRANDGLGAIFRFFAGAYHGRFETKALVPDFATGTPGTMAITRVFDGTIVMGKSYNNAAEIVQLPPGGLAGQIIINADADPVAAWAAPVYIGPPSGPGTVVLDAPGYAMTAESLGGGSIGLVPFALHDVSCVPASGGTVAPAGGGSTLVARLRHYGPIALGKGDPVTIERRPIDSGGPFGPVSGTGFAFTVDPDDANTLLVAAAGAESGFEAGFEYRLTPTSTLLCAVPAQPPVQWELPYQIGVTVPACDGDVDGTGDVNVVDLVAVLAFWGPVTPQTEHADIDGSGLIDVADLLAVLQSWGQCP